MRNFFRLVFPIITVFLSSTSALNDLTSRALVDVCAQVDSDLTITNLVGVPVVVGFIDACICESALPIFIQTNVVAEGAVLLFGQAKVIAALTALINGAPGSQQCDYPHHAVPTCEAGNPCSFTCTDGFTVHPAGDYPTSCVCTSPNTVCDGKCGYFPSCASSLVRRAVSYRIPKSGYCPMGAVACPVPGRGRAAWECVNTMSDLESCGGCIYTGAVGGPAGVDCTAIEGVSDVACHNGRCVVNRCMPGYQSDDHGSLCVGDGRSELDAIDILAAEFGL